MRVKLIFGGAVLFILLLMFVILVDTVTIQGNEVGVMETWSGGIKDEPLQPRTYFLFPAFMYDVYSYDISSQVHVMNDNEEDEFGSGRVNDSYLVQSSEGQDMHISLNVRWRPDPEKIVEMHKTVRGNFEEKLIRPVVMRVVKDEATQMQAIDAYSGVGLVKLQSAIHEHLRNSELAERGIVIENFVIEGIALDSEYIGQIKRKQVAIQSELRAVQEQKAAMAEAQKAKAEAQADYERRVVEAERDKAVGILSAEEKAQQEVLAAEAAKKKEVLAAEGEMQSGELKAQAILAIGKAEAEAQKLRLSAYAVPGAESFVKIEVAKSLAEGFKNIKGYVPESMKINVLSESFTKSLDAVIEVGSSDEK